MASQDLTRVFGQRVRGSFPNTPAASCSPKIIVVNSLIRGQHLDSKSLSLSRNSRLYPREFDLRANQRNTKYVTKVENYPRSCGNHSSNCISAGSSVNAETQLRKNQSQSEQRNRDLWVNGVNIFCNQCGYEINSFRLPAPLAHNSKFRPKSRENSGALDMEVKVYGKKTTINNGINRNYNTDVVPQRKTDEEKRIAARGYYGNALRKIKVIGDFFKELKPKKK